jgi:phosphatidate phosphatase LPIN
VTGKIFLWDYRTKIIISDIDGTITKSDVLGHVMPRFGNDWAHAGITQLFQNINKNGYQMLYLTARAIGQASTTRLYIEGLKQDNIKLPDGPMVMSPDRLMRSFKREVILRKPHVFKIACLKNILQLFPSSNPPFYCGFGNRDSDAMSYREVGIPDGKIFIINPDGDLYNVESP